jgi:aryl-alcohol dehydrogenase-like predicted oxidoreductase
VLDELEAVAEEVGATVAQTAIAYHTHHDSIAAPIVGARTVDQLEENLGAADVDLSDEQFERLQASKGGPYSDI